MAACSSDGTVRVFDLRSKFSSVQHITINAHDTDVNVISWNEQSVNFIASGADDGSFKVWDLRHFDK